MTSCAALELRLTITIAADAELQIDRSATSLP
jgi:hypothetical protein